MAARAVVRFRDRPDLIYVAPPVTGLMTPDRRPDIFRSRPHELPKPFWSRNSKNKECVIPAEVDPSRIEAAELHVVVWDGGVERVESPLTWNGQPLPFRSDGHHDVRYLRLPIEPNRVRQGLNTFAVISDTTHHGIEVLLPGPELFVRMKPEPGEGRRFDPDEFRQAAMNAPEDPQRGAELFASARTKCATCHRVHGKGGDIGPDLSLVGGKLDRTQLIESVLEPSAQILEGYRGSIVELTDGRTLIGVISDEDENGFSLGDAEGSKSRVSARDVESRRWDAKSLMPSDMIADLTPTEFADLIAYLESLRAGRNLSPGEGITGAVAMPDGCRATRVADGLTGCTALEVSPDGRVFVCEQTGVLRVVKDGRLLPEPFVTLPVAHSWERGLIGVTLDPDFPKTPFVHVCYVAAQPHPHHVISRFIAVGDRAEPGSEVVLFTGDDQTKLGGGKLDGHQGGALHFGPDGKLYVGIGEQTAEMPAQHLRSLLGKILRLNPDGTIPTDNPFYDRVDGKYRAVWALGCRNPFTFAFQPETGRMYINDVGGKAEEINEGLAGANYGWPTADHGPTDDPRFRGPVHHYPTACIAGGAFCPRASPWPAEYRGRYFFADFNHGFVKTLDPESPAIAHAFANGFRRPTDIRFSSDGSLYVLTRDAWVIDGLFRHGTGALFRVEHVGDTAKNER